jgi:single-stranded DNA-binding protein
MAKYCQKGKMVSVVGRIQTRNYEGSDGRKVYVTEVVATDVRYLPDGKTQAPNADQGLIQGAKVTAFVDDLPFDN